MAAMRCSNWIFREILSAVPIASTRRFWIRRSVDFSQDLVHLCKLTFVFGKHVMKSISVTWPIPVRTRPSSCCWWVSMNFLIEPSVTLSDLGWRSFRNNPRIRWNTSENVLSKFYKEDITCLPPVQIKASYVGTLSAAHPRLHHLLCHFGTDCLIDVQKLFNLVSFTLFCRWLFYRRSEVILPRHSCRQAGQRWAKLDQAPWASDWILNKKEKNEQKFFILHTFTFCFEYVLKKYWKMMTNQPGQDILNNICGQICGSDIQLPQGGRLVPLRRHHLVQNRNLKPAFFSFFSFSELTCSPTRPVCWSMRQVRCLHLWWEKLIGLWI